MELCQLLRIYHVVLHYLVFIICVMTIIITVMSVYLKSSCHSISGMALLHHLDHLSIMIFFGILAVLLTAHKLVLLFVQSEDVPAPLFRSLQLDAPQTHQRGRFFHSLGIGYLN